MGEITPETIRQLAQAAGIRPDAARLDELAQSLAAIIEALERCEDLGLEAFEPAINLGLDDRSGDVRG